MTPARWRWAAAALGAVTLAVGIVSITSAPPPGSLIHGGFVLVDVLLLTTVVVLRRASLMLICVAMLATAFANAVGGSVWNEGWARVGLFVVAGIACIGATVALLGDAESKSRRSDDRL